jgi:signal transduction histidine kinase
MGRWLQDRGGRVKGKSGGIRRELILGLTAIVLLGGIASHVVILVCSRSNFDALVQKSDIDIAKSIADSLAPFYGLRGTWAGVEVEIDALRLTVLKQGALPVSREEEHHIKDGVLPLVVTDIRGVPVYPIVRVSSMKESPDGGVPGHYPVKGGVQIMWDGKTVGYVFFKSMLKRSYNSHEAAFINSLIVSILISVSAGALLAILLGSFLSDRFVRPIISLDGAVQRIANGESGVRAEKSRADEIGRLAENFNAMAEKIEKTEAARKNLLADVAHELRTPVSILQANLEMIIDGVYTADRARLESLYDETRILTELIGNLRDISDLESGISRFDAHPVRLYPLLAETCEKYRPLFAGRGMTVSLQLFDDETVCVSSDENRLRQVVRNILMNALKYAPEDSSVSVSCARVGGGSGNAARVSIADEGPGVPDPDLGKIFERFYRVDSSRNRDSGGRGLGLAICRQFIESSGGTIFAANRRPHGLIVSFELPFCDCVNA